MLRTYLLDTSVYSQPIRRQMHAGVVGRWDGLSQANSAVSAICEAEVLFGLKKNGSDRMRSIYDATLRGRFPVLPIDAEVAATYADLRAECEGNGVKVQDMDLLIAATAKTHGLTIATLNGKDFKCIAGLKVEDWSIAQENTDVVQDS